MKHSEAVMHLERMMTAAQKARSISFETGGGLLTEEDLALVDRWLFGQQNIVSSLVHKLDLDSTGQAPLTPVEFFNFMVVASRSSLIQVCLIDYGTGAYKLPDPDSSWVRGWEAE